MVHNKDKSTLILQGEMLLWFYKIENSFLPTDYHAINQKEYFLQNMIQIRVILPRMYQGY